jgi:Copper type II ascorbate-dependent monooxygenase, C-terminal domain/Copper type II ascorbate-dependent monooxygenase, N-terminal domain
MSSSRPVLRSAPILLAALLLLACDPPPEGITFGKDVAPLLEEHCATCHQAGGIGPFPLTSYNDAKLYADAIAVVTEARLMPPSPIDASGACRDFKDARWLTDAEIEIFKAWAKAGAPEGEPVDVAVPKPTTLETADAVLTMPEPYTPKSTDGAPNDDYRCFLLPSVSEVDAYVQGFEIVPGDPTEVHHMLLFSLLSDGGVQQVQALDDASEGAGWPCFSTPFDDESSFIAGWAPGDNTILYPEDTGVFLAGGRPLVMQIHYNLLAGARPDQTTVKLKTVASVRSEAVITPIAHTELALQPGLADVRTEASFPLVGLADDLLLYGVFPHMHTLGETLELAVAPLGEADNETCLVNVWRWNFHWQRLAFYQQPLVVRASDTVRIACNYDTTSRTETVYWGEGTQEEMCLAFVYVTRINGGPISGLVE